MSDYLHDNGFYYSTNEVVNFAKDAGMDFDDFIKDRKLKPTEDILTDDAQNTTDDFYEKGTKIINSN